MAALTFSHIGITVPDLEKAVDFYCLLFALLCLVCSNGAITNCGYDFINFTLPTFS